MGGGGAEEECFFLDGVGFGGRGGWVSDGMVAWGGCCSSHGSGVYLSEEL
jgi:hypothetical protein